MSLSLTLAELRDCLDGAVPSAVATCAADGTPNVSTVSHVQYVDESHVALSFQFFSKTRENVLATRRAVAQLVHPQTGASFRLRLEYLRTETEGPLFERMKARLAGIASHTGMSGVFKLRGSDVYRVARIEQVPGSVLPMPPRANLLPLLRECAERFGVSGDLGTLLDSALGMLDKVFGIRHAMILMLDGTGKRLFTVASRGYDASGVGSEIAVGCGVIGVAAAQATPIRITHMTAEYSYGNAVRESAQRDGLADLIETAIPFPGLPDSRSQLAVPIVVGGRRLGVLYVESPQDLRFGYDDEDALVAFAAPLGLAILHLQQSSEAVEEAPAPPSAAAPARGEPVVIRHYPADNSVFIGEDYLIKGVAGAIFAKLARERAEQGRSEFTNRELRLDPTLRLPELGDNLEARLILLQRRLAERCSFLRIEKTGRGRFRLAADRAYRLQRA
ncbi:MAG TPA: GAF domain-containing protein [Burkholderiales bacterium]|nr:GAF domain-containing protein [Burkholderiales bacterium]